MIKEEYRVACEKLDAAAALLRKSGIDAWLILNREASDPSLPLLIGTTSIHEAAVFLMPDGRHLILASESDRGNFDNSGLFAEVIPYGHNFEAALAALIARIAPRRLALNYSLHDHLCDGLTVGQYEILSRAIGAERLAAIETSSEPMLKEIRSIKTPAELARIRQAIAYTQDIFEEVAAQARCGMTERELGELFVAGMKKRGVVNGHEHPFDPPLVCIVRAGLAHRKPGDTAIVPGDIVIMDMCVKYRDYCSDIARTMYFLRPGETRAPADVQHAFDTAIGAITASIDCIAAGKRGHEVDAAGRRAIEAGGYPTIRHSVGHQVGRQCHDGGTRLGPPAKADTDGIVQVGEVYAIEPTVIQDGGLPCMLVEENVVITPEGPELLSKRQLALVAIPC
ncbi:M24 family metallopeptidase [Cohnella rhizosphaerae]|uniref:Xaa-Pro peptidase family protein n=1 Tax=Cohnella rhizosphaerae TaxID=1457232 RepID=A0A9X4QU78_9BACL|nr:Xaa-Pro peptidase family protein [Cohnella rhizosphaerae]MDG0811435.1 Xaa-Pro peptidase family protein [Cohnella rhizosphaerae]